MYQEAKKQRRLRRLYNQKRHEQRLRIPKYHVTGVPEKEDWSTRLLRFFKSFFNIAI